MLQMKKMGINFSKFKDWEPNKTQKFIDCLKKLYCARIISNNSYFKF